MPQKPSTRHHYLPEFYLRRWMPGGREPLVQFHRPYGDKVVPQRVFPKQTGFVKRKKAPAKLDPAIAAAAEVEFYSPVDHKASAVLDKIERGERDFSIEERSAWVRFILSLVFRNPDEFEAAVDLLAQGYLTVTKEQERQYQRERKPDDPATFKEVMQEQVDAGRAAQAVLSEFVDMNNSQKIGDLLVKMEWLSFTPPIHVRALLTSDRPVIMEGPLNHPEFHLLMPVGPRRIFVAAKSKAVAADIAASRASHMREYLNRLVTARARSYVYGYSDAELPFVQEHFSTDPQEPIAVRVARRREILKRNSVRSG